MMFLAFTAFLLILAASSAIAVAHPGLRDVVREAIVVVLATIPATRFKNIPTFLAATLTSSSSRLTKRESDVINNIYQQHDERLLTSTFIVLIVVCVLLAFIVIAIIVWVLWYVWFRKWYQSRRSRRNPEKERAEELLNSSRGPLDLELGVIHARSPDNWPLTDGVTIPTATPVGASSTHSNQTQTTLSDTSNLGAVVEGVDITDISVPERFVADIEMMQTFQSNTNDSDHDLDAAHGVDIPFDLSIPHSDTSEFRAGTETDDWIHSPAPEDETWSTASDIFDLESVSAASGVGGSEPTGIRSEPSSLHSPTFETISQEDTIYEPESPNIYADNGIIGKDWAYHAA